MEKYKTISGILFVIAGLVAFWGIITGEIFYPEYLNYTTRVNEISDLGATRPPNSIIIQPSATIFNTSMILSGVFLLAGSHYLRAAKFDKATAIVVSILGLAVFFVGIFPGNRALWHGLSAMVTFISGALAAIISSRVVSRSSKYIFIIFGLSSLIFLFGAGRFIPIFGMGGTERYVVYPVILWILIFGSYLIGKNE